MKFTLSWLKKFLNIEASPQEIAEKLTLIGMEVEKINDLSKTLSNFKVAEIIEANQHPNADKLKVCMVNNGDKELQIVCGAPNARKGIKVVLAEVGTLIPKGEFRIKASEIRGVKSEGMLCSSEELLIDEASEGIIELPKDAKVGTSFLDYYNNDPMIEISVTPNRGDCLGVYGIARELAASGLGTLKPLDISKIEPNFTSSFKAKVDDPKLAPLFVVREFRNVNNVQSPEWLQNLLKNVGISPISAIVDITNYISYSFARPLHAYDKDKLADGLEVRPAMQGEKFLALNDKEYELNSNDIVIAREKGVEALAGIIGGKSSACEINTKNIILEAAIFDRASISKTGRRLHIDTDARYRFERNVDPAFTIDGIEIASKMILEICGGEASNNIICGSIQSKNKELEFAFNVIEKKAGIQISQEESLKLLEKLGFTIISKTQDSAKISIPSWRSDISIPEDIVEEIARMYGYDKLPMVPLPRGNEQIRTRLLTLKQRRMRDARRILTNRGLNEVVSWSFMHEKTAEIFAPLADNLRIANPISSQLGYMRPTIIPNLLELIAKNKDRSFENIALFEVGPIFTTSGSDIEKQAICAIRCGNFSDKTVHSMKRAVDIYDIKADLEILLEEFGINRLQFISEAPTYFHPNKSGAFKLGNKLIAHFGELHPKISNNIEDRVVAFELYLDEIPESKVKYGKKGQYIVSDYQLVKRDFAFVVGEYVKVGEILSFVSTIEKELIKEVTVFDIFKGGSLPVGTKSIALNVLLQAQDRTLTESELQAVSDKIIKEVEQKFDAHIRN